MNAPYREVRQYLRSRQFVLDEQRYVSERDEYEPRDSEGYRRFDVRYMFTRNTPIPYSHDSVTVYAHVKTKSHLGPYAEPYEVYRMVLSTAEGRYEIIESDGMRYWKDTLNRRLPEKRSRGMLRHPTTSKRTTDITSYSPKTEYYKDPVLVYITQDESGNLGRSLPKERNYVITATVIMDRDEYEHATSDLFGELVEVKFHDATEEERMAVLEKAGLTIRDVYYVAYNKPRSIHNTNEGVSSEYKTNIHTKASKQLADYVIAHTKENMYVNIDHTNLIKDKDAEKIYENNDYIYNQKVTAKVSDSAQSQGLITNDYITGAVGHMVNRTDEQNINLDNKRYVNRLGVKPVRVFLKNMNIKRQGKFSKPRNRRVENHTNVP